MRSHRFLVSHDHGQETVSVWAKNKAAAIQMLMSCEKCPRRAITDNPRKRRNSRK